MLTSIPDLLVVGGAMLLIFGPKRLPEVAKALGSGLRDFKKALNSDLEEASLNTPQNKALPASETDNLAK